jgi:hypothetical protein
VAEPRQGFRQQGRLPRREPLVEHLQRNGRIGRVVLRPIDGPKPAGADLVEHPVGTKCLWSRVEQ